MDFQELSKLLFINQFSGLYLSELSQSSWFFSMFGSLQRQQHTYSNLFIQFFGLICHLKTDLYPLKTAQHWIYRSLKFRFRLFLVSKEVKTKQWLLASSFDSLAYKRILNNTVDWILCLRLGYVSNLLELLTSLSIVITSRNNVLVTRLRRVRLKDSYSFGSTVLSNNFEISRHNYQATRNNLSES